MPMTKNPASTAAMIGSKAKPRVFNFFARRSFLEHASNNRRGRKSLWPAGVVSKLADRLRDFFSRKAAIHRAAQMEGYLFRLPGCDQRTHRDEATVAGLALPASKAKASASAAVVFVLPFIAIFS